MKKLYIFLALAAAILAPGALSAQNGAPLYAVGDFGDITWSISNTTQFDWDGTQYTLDIEAVSCLKISSSTGDWDIFNENSLSTEGNAVVGDNILFPSTNNINLPWHGHWILTVNADLSVLNLWTDTTPSEKKEIYLRGSFDDCVWGAVPEYMFATEDNNIFTLTCKVNPDDEFKIADEYWGTYNFGLNEGDCIYLDEPIQCIQGSNYNMRLSLEETTRVTFTFNLNTAYLIVTKAESEEPDPEEEKDGDYNGDGYVDVQDVYDLLQYIHVGGR